MMFIKCTIIKQFMCVCLLLVDLLTGLLISNGNDID